MDKKRYFKIYHHAIKDHKDAEFKSDDEKKELMQKGLENYEKPLEKQIYSNNYLMGDHQTFLKVFNDNGKDVHRTAEAFNLATSDIVEKIIELMKYAEYINELTPIIKKDDEQLRVEDDQILEEAKMLIKKLDVKKD